MTADPGDGAQFEREVTGERIRDKIAASKRKGMWMGGVPPLGYDVENPSEAKLIRHIFQRFVELGSGTAVVKEHAGGSGLPRLPAAKLESAVLDQLRAILRSPDLLGEVLHRAMDLDPTLDEPKVTVAMTQLDAIWDQLFPAEQIRIVKLLVEKVIVSPTDLEVRLRANGIERMVSELQPANADQPEEAVA